MSLLLQMGSRSTSDSKGRRRRYTRSRSKLNGKWGSHSRSCSRLSSSPSIQSTVPARYRPHKYSNSRSFSRSTSPRYSNHCSQCCCKRHYDSRTPTRSRSRSNSRSPSPLREDAMTRQPRGKPAPSRCIGVFGLSVATTQPKIREIFSKYGPIERIQVVIDAQTGQSRGFCFIYYELLADAICARNNCSGLELDGRRIRVDFSVTERAHTPTPGAYKGRSTRGLREKYNTRKRREKSPSPYLRSSETGYRRRHPYERSSCSYSPHRSRY